MNRDRIREIFLANGFTVKEGQTDLKPYVYAAAEALLAEVRLGGIPDEFVPVPVEPTREMLDNGCCALSSPFDWKSGRKEVRRVYRAMLEAAPKPEVRDV